MVKMNQSVFEMQKQLKNVHTSHCCRESLLGMPFLCPNGLDVYRFDVSQRFFNAPMEGFGTLR